MLDQIQKAGGKDPLKRQSIDTAIVEKQRKRDNELQPAVNQAQNK